MSSVEVVIPAYNEQDRIQPTLEAYVRAFQQPQMIFTVVLNGCTDQTAAVVERVRARWPHRIRVKEVRAAIGKGGAILKGWKESNSEWVGFVDADGATSPEEFEKLLRARKDADGVIASRFLPGARAHRSGIRFWLSLGFRFFVAALFHLPFKDTQCGAKLFRRSAIEPLFPSLRITDMVFDVNLLVEAVRKGLIIKEVPTEWTEQTKSQMFRSFSRQVIVSWKMFLSLLKLKWLTYRHATK